MKAEGTKAQRRWRRSSQSLSAHVIFDDCESEIRALGRFASVPHVGRGQKVVGKKAIAFDRRNKD